jgi:hypothetical protein
MRASLLPQVLSTCDVAAEHDACCRKGRFAAKSALQNPEKPASSMHSPLSDGENAKTLATAKLSHSPSYCSRISVVRN